MRFLEVDTATGSRGAVFLLNIPALAERYTVTITRARAGHTRSFAWPVQRGAIEWLAPAAPSSAFRAAEPCSHPR